MRTYGILWNPGLIRADGLNSTCCCAELDNVHTAAPWGCPALDTDGCSSTRAPDPRIPQWQRDGGRDYKSEALVALNANLKFPPTKLQIPKSGEDEMNIDG